MASNQKAMASNLIAMASNLVDKNLRLLLNVYSRSDGLYPNRDGLQPSRLLPCFSSSDECLLACKCLLVLPTSFVQSLQTEMLSIYTQNIPELDVFFSRVNILQLSILQLSKKLEQVQFETTPCIIQDLLQDFLTQVGSQGTVLTANRTNPDRSVHGQEPLISSVRSLLVVVGFCCVCNPWPFWSCSILLSLRCSVVHLRPHLSPKHQMAAVWSHVCR